MICWKSAAKVTSFASEQKAPQGDFLQEKQRKNISSLTRVSSAVGVFSLIGVILAFAMFLAIGRLVPGSEEAPPALLGWSAAYLLSVLAALIGVQDLRIVLALCVVLAVLSLVWRRQRYLFRFTGGAVPLYLGGAALLVLSVLTMPVYWDSYAHWLPNSSYLFQLHHFPRSPLNDFPSLHPTYPAALPLLLYVASQLTLHFAELGGSVLNVLLSLIAMEYVIRLLSASSEAPLLPRYGLAVLAFCIVVPLNPAIELQHYWSAIADPILGVLVFISIVVLCRLMTREGSTLFQPVAALFLLGVLMGGLKPSSWLLGPILAAATALVALLQRVPARRWGAPVLAFAFGTLCIDALWKLYLQRNLPIADQFSIQPLHAWRFDLAKALLSGIAADVREHWVYWTMVTATLAVGARVLIQRSFITDPTIRLMVGVASVAMVLHLMSLVASYLGSGFADWEIAQAACLQRYSSQVGYAVCVSGLTALSLALLRVRRERFDPLSPKKLTFSGAAISLVLFAVFTLRPTLPLARTSEQNEYRRELAESALRSVPAGERLAIVADRWSLNYLRYESWVDLKAPERPRVVARHQILHADTRQIARETLMEWMRNPGIDAILIFDAPEFATENGLSADGNQVWFRRDAVWRVIPLGRAD